MPPSAPSSVLAAVARGRHVTHRLVVRNNSSSLHGHRNAWQSRRRCILIRSLSSLPSACEVPDRILESEETTKSDPVNDETHETPALGLRESIAERSAGDDKASPQPSVGDDRIVSVPSLNILEALKTDSFNATDGDISSENDVGLDAAKPSPQDTTTNGKGKPSLSELLMVDIYSKSWSEPDTNENNSRFGRRRGGDAPFQPRWDQNDTFGRTRRYGGREESDWRGNRRTQMREPRTFSNEGDVMQESSEMSSAAQLEFSELADQSASLLDRLYGDDESSTLQLMDFDAVMTRWSQFHQKAGDMDRDLKQDASHECTKLLEALEQNYDDVARSLAGSDGTSDVPQPRHSRLMPNAVSYNLVLHTLANSGKGPKVAGEAVAILNKMLDRCEEYIVLVDSSSDENASTALPPPPEPTVITFNSTLHAIAKSGAEEAGYYAEDVYLRMEEWTKERKHQGRVSPDKCHYRGAIPNARTLSCLLDAWTRKTSQRYGGFAGRSEALLLSAVKRRQKYVNAVVGRVDGEALESNEHHDHSKSFDDEDDVIEEEVVDEEGSLANIELSDISTVEGADVIEDETQWVDLDIPSLKPNTVAFNTSIHAWASSQRGSNGARRAQELLKQLETFSESEELEGPEGWIDPSSLVDDGMDEHDLNLCPNVRSYSMVMNAWSNAAAVEIGSGESAALHCEAILAKMEERGADDASIRPNIFAYTTCISAWANTKDVEHAASRAEGILNRLLDTHYADSQSDLPSFEGVDDDAGHAAPFNSVITAYARSSDPSSTDRALGILDRLDAYSIPPTLTSYNAALDACARHGDPDRGQAVLERMRKKGFEPDSTSYNTILNCYARSLEPLRGDRAWDFLYTLEDRRESGDSRFVPSRISYASVLNAYARESGDEEYGGIATVKRAKAVYDRFVEKVDHGHLFRGTDSHCNAAFLNCCANVYGTRSERKEALIMAIQAFEEMKRDPSLHGEINHYIFGTMFKACIRLSSDSQECEKLLKSLFVQACNRGCLSKAVLGQFLKSTPSQLNLRVIVENGGSKRSIPKEWHSKVPPNHKPSPPSAAWLADDEAREMKKVERQSLNN